ncbi:hypothetical protein GVAV_000583 [Gurleya vavrai]
MQDNGKIKPETIKHLKSLNSSLFVYHLNCLFKIYPDKLPKEICPYIIKCSLDNFYSEVHHKILKKCPIDILQQIYPGLLSFYIIKKECNKSFIFILENVLLNKNEQKMIIEHFKKNYDDDVYKFLYLNWKLVFFGSKLISKKVDVPWECVFEEICNTISIFFVKKNNFNNEKNYPDQFENINLQDKKNCSDRLENSILHDKKNIADLQENDNSDKNICLDSQESDNLHKYICLDWIENDNFGSKNEFNKILEILISTKRFCYNENIYKYLVYNKKTNLLKIYEEKYVTKMKNSFISKNIKNCDILFLNENKISINDFDNFLSHKKNMPKDLNIKNVILFYLTDSNFKDTFLFKSKIMNFSEIINTNCEFFVAEIINLFNKHSLLNFAFNILVNFIQNFHKKEIEIVFGAFFDKMYIYENKKLFLKCIDKIIKMRRVSRNCIEYIFEELAYLDDENEFTRCFVYEILESVFDDYYEMDNLIEKKNLEDEDRKKEEENKNDKVINQKYEVLRKEEKLNESEKEENKIDDFFNQKYQIIRKEEKLNESDKEENICQKFEIPNKKDQPKKQKNNIRLKNFDIEAETNEKKIIEHDHKINLQTRIIEFNYKRIDKRNVKVFAAKLWDDLKENKNKFEFYNYIKLLTKIIKCTGDFYEKRMQKDKILNNILDTFEKYKNEIIWDDIFDNFLYVCIENFVLTKKNFEEITIHLIKNYKSDDFLLKLLAKKDFYFLYYLAIENTYKNILKMLYRVDRKILYAY